MLDRNGGAAGSEPTQWGSAAIPGGCGGEGTGGGTRAERRIKVSGPVETGEEEGDQMLRWKSQRERAKAA